MIGHRQGKLIAPQSKAQCKLALQVPQDQDFVSSLAPVEAFDSFRVVSQNEQSLVAEFVNLVIIRDWWPSPLAVYPTSVPDQR